MLLFLVIKAQYMRFLFTVLPDLVAVPVAIKPVLTRFL